MDPHRDARPSVVRGGLAVMLVSASDLDAASRVAAAAVGAPASAPPAVVEGPGGDSGDLGADLADGLIADADDGRTGLAVVALEPAADPLEVALVLEHVVEARHPGSTPIGILDVVAVSSVAEIRALLLEPGDADATPFDAAERLAGRLECASVVVLDDLDPDRPGPDARRAVALLAHLAPDARVVATPDRDALAPAPLRIGRQRARSLAAGMGWQVALAGEAGPTTADGMGVHVFRDPRPFHPGRLHHAVMIERDPAGGADHIPFEHHASVAQSCGYLRDDMLALVRCVTACRQQPDGCAGFGLPCARRCHALQQGTRRAVADYGDSLTAKDLRQQVANMVGGHDYLIPPIGAEPLAVLPADKLQACYLL